MKFFSESESSHLLCHPLLAAGCFTNTGEPKRSKAIRAPAWDGKQNWHSLCHKTEPTAGRGLQIRMRQQQSQRDTGLRRGQPLL
jgi:hypothetical protein